MDGFAIAALVRRNMRSLAGFVRAGSETPSFPLTINDDEVLIGWYENPPPFEASVVVFTTQAIIQVNDGQARERTPFADILEYTLPRSKIEAEGVEVLTTSGREFIRMAGRHGPFQNKSDAFGLVQLLHSYMRAKGRWPRA